MTKIPIGDIIIMSRGKHTRAPLEAGSERVNTKQTLVVEFARKKFEIFSLIPLTNYIKYGIIN